MSKIWIIVGLVALSVIVALAGCRTINGFGRDIQDATRQYEK